jgi:hypothetical protein
VAKKQPGLTPVPEGTGNWLNSPERVTAPSPGDRSIPCIFRLSARDYSKLARAGRRQLNFELWSVVLGVPPPVPGCDHRNRDVKGELTCLNDAHALFRGIERPLAEDDDGAEVLAYIQKPRFFYEYDPNMVSVALKSPVPDDLVFVTYARLDEVAPGTETTTKGTITHWGFVEADRSDPTLPVGYLTRYRERLW